MATTRQRLRVPYAQWWDVIHHAFIDQGQKAKVKWVKGHSGNKGNEAADKEARAAQERDTEQWDVHQEAHIGMRCNIGFMGKPAEDDLRKMLKLQAAVRMHQIWTNQQRTQKYIGDIESVAWAPTLRIIHNNNPPGRAYTSRKDCALRAHRIKKMHGMLPTLQAMARRNPGLYPSTFCRRCEQETETVEHLWECEDTMEMQMEAWKQAIEKTNEDGMRAWRKYHTEWKEEQEKARQVMKVIRKSPPEFKSADEEEIWDSIEWIGGVRKRRDGADDASDDESGEEDAKVWTVQDLYHGLTPMNLVTIWKGIFSTTRAIATYVVAKFVARIEEFGRSEIWGSRCSLTVDWERSNGITSVSKRARGRTGVEEHLRSAGDFSDLNHRHMAVLSELEIKAEADDRVLEHYTGRCHLGLMERLGGLTTTLLTMGLD
jgi:hypothetical protein